MAAPSDAAIHERAWHIATEAVYAVVLQHRRLRSIEPEDHTFVLRWWTDLQFLVIALRRLRRAGELALRSNTAAPAVKVALDEFDHGLPSLRTMRNIGEHIDAYAADSPKRYDKSIDRRQLEVGSWNGRTFRWLVKQDGTQHELDTEAALAAAERFYDDLRCATESATE
jgi:hypothetical protein